MVVFVWISVLLILFSECIYNIVGNREDLRPYEAECKFLISNSLQAKLTCINALFSPIDFELRGMKAVLFKSDLCKPESDLYDGAIGMVNRGSCSFDTKAINGMKSGLKGLIIVNTDENEVFPMGCADSSWNISIPVVMIPNSIEVKGIMAVLVKGKAVRIDLRKEDEKKRIKNNDSIIEIVTKSINTLTILISFYLTRLFWRFLTNFYMQAVRSEKKEAIHRRLFSFEDIFGVLLIAVLFVISRITTFRLVSNSNHIQSRKTRLFNYYHTETDEAIFETLIRTVHEDFWNYSLQPSKIIETFQLAKENYDFPIFHHPPLFVYLSSYLHYSVFIPLPFLSILYQLMPLLLIPLILSSLLRNTTLEHRTSSISLRAMVLWMICPIASFCSQKLWIDNALVMTTTIGLWIYLIGVEQLVLQSSKSVSLISSILLGIASFGLPINTKVSSIGMLPFMMIYLWWRIWQQRRHSSDKKTALLQWIVMLSVGVLIGSVVSFLPWTYYYHKMTGRWMPSAIPTKEMLEKYPFVAKAVNKPWFNYLYTLLHISPCHLVGMLFSLIAVVSLIFKFSFHGQDQQQKILKEKEDKSMSTSKDDQNLLLGNVLCLASLPIGYVAVLTMVGILGGGYQTRFILPVLPASIMLSAIVIEWVGKGGSNALFSAVEMLLIVYSSCLSLYYCNIFSVYYADVDHSLWKILVSILQHSYSIHLMNKETLSILRHFGVIA